MMAMGPMGFKRNNINQQAEVHHGGSSAVWVGEQNKQKNKQTNKKTNHWNAIYNNNKTRACTLMAVVLLRRILALHIIYCQS